RESHLGNSKTYQRGNHNAIINKRTPGKVSEVKGDRREEP
ncbi:unnamed protein product, partial [marine sediment metagenome]